MLSEELVDIATRNQVYLEGLKAGELKSRDAFFRKLNSDLLAALLELDDPRLDVLTLIQQAALIEKVRKAQTASYQAELTTFVNMLRDLADYSREFELESLDEVSDDRVTPTDNQDDKGAGLWAAVQQRPMGATGALLAAWLGAWMANEVTRGSNLIRRGIAEGWTVTQLATAFKGTAAASYSDGLFASSKRNTASTFNTAIQHVATTSRVYTMERVIFEPKGATGLKVDPEGKVTSIPLKARAAANDAGIKVGDKISLMGYRWVSILDNATTQICRSLDGQVFGFGSGPVPPAHVNCRSSIIAELLGRWLKRGPSGRFVKRDERAATGAKGPERVDGTVKYYDWLKTQPEAFQNDALGVTRAKLFRDGGMSAATFARLNLGRNFRPLTLDEMRRLKPNAFRRAGV